MWELLTTEVPFSDCDPMQMRARLINHQRPEIPNPLPSGFPPAYVELMKQCWQQVTSTKSTAPHPTNIRARSIFCQDPFQRPDARQALDALIAIDASAHVNGPIRLYPDGLTVPASSVLLTLLSTAIPDAAAQQLLLQIVHRVDDLARGAPFVSEMTTRGLTLLEAHCICAYTCDARDFGGAREESPFFMCVRRRARGGSRDFSLVARCRYNKALREVDLEAVARWSNFSCVFDSGLSKLPGLKRTVYR
jgi:hypothetical protein